MGALAIREIEEYDWWKDEKFVAKLDKEYEDFENGKTKAFSVEEVKKTFDLMKEQEGK